MLEHIGQVGLIERMAIDREADRSLVVAKTLQRLLEPPDIAARPGDQRKWADRCLLAQRLELGRIMQRAVHRRIARGFQSDLVGLRIRPRRQVGQQQQGDNHDENEHTAHGAHGNGVWGSPDCHGCGIVRKQ
jgi:hypothetical protein